MITVDGGALTHRRRGARRSGARSRDPRSRGARRGCGPAREVVDRLDREGAVVYGVTTGFGALADRAVDPADRALLQRSVVLSHAAGSGPRLDDEVVRGMILLRARTLAAGLSGVRVELVEALLGAARRGRRPLGAGARLARRLGRPGAARRDRHRAARSGMDARRQAASASTARHALRAHGLTPIDVEPKEGLALINGTDAMTSLLALAVHDIEELLRLADIACALSVEALLGTTVAYDERVVGAASRPGTGRLGGEPARAAPGKPDRRVAPPLAPRRPGCVLAALRAPGARRRARRRSPSAAQTVEHELASVVDNPVVLGDEVVSAGNFHGQALAYAADMLASACADVAAISERRVDRLLDPARSRGLPAFLSPEPGLNSGLMITQYTAAAMVASLRHAATPFAVQSAATSAGQEDHVSMGYEAALRTRRSVGLLRAGARHRGARRGAGDRDAPSTPARGGDRRGDRHAARARRRRSPPTASSAATSKPPRRGRVTANGATRWRPPG